MRNLPDRERDRDVGRLGGIARGARYTPPPGAARAGLSAGLAAGVIFVLFQTAAGAAGGSWSAWLRASASLVAGRSTLSPQFPLGAAVVLGLVAITATSAFWGAVFGSLAARVRRARGAGLAAAGAAFGLAVWAVDRALASLAWPWMGQVSPAVQAAGHALFFGLPLALFFAAMWREQ